MKNLFSTFLSLCSTAIIVAAGLVAFAVHVYVAPGPLKQPALFMVEKGQGVTAIAQNLKTQGIIEYPLLFRLAARARGADKAIKAGEYEFAAGSPMREILGKMETGDVYLRKFTIAEGLTSWQVVQFLNAQEDLAGDAITAIPKEGSLLPETYTYTRGDTKQDQIGKMQEAMSKALESLWAAKPPTAPVLLQGEVVILASIVEKETGVAAERPRIAGVFINRLKKGIPLQTDPTVIYAITKGEIQSGGQGPLGRRLLSKDLQFESPYNTYKYPGLPPGPIANPGREALAAVLNPEIHDFYYFVADGSGGHVFARTLEEHNANVAKWREIRKSQGN